MEPLYYLGFSAFPGIGAKRFSALLQHFGSAQAAWEGKSVDIQQVLGEVLAQKFTEFRKTFSIEAYAKTLEKKDIQYVTWVDEGYPVLLKEFLPGNVIASPDLSGVKQSQHIVIPTKSEGRVEGSQKEIADQARNDVQKSTSFLPPFLLYAKGNLEVLQHPNAIGVVGTRKITEYGKEVTKTLTSELVAQGMTIVSGLALGVDGIAHKTALENSGPTIAVLGSSVDFCTPREHQGLYTSILQNNGCIVSQFALGETVGVGHFPARNKIIAGLSLGILVTEGAADSGALLTAEDAKKLGKPIFSVPGPITSILSKGPNNLLKEGAIVVSSGYDIIERLEEAFPYVIPARQSAAGGKAGIQPIDPAPGKRNGSLMRSGMIKRGDTKEEQSILVLLQTGPLLFDDIVRKMNTDSSVIGSLLSLMEIKGLVKSLSDGTYSLS